MSFPYTELLLWGSKESPGLGSQLLPGVGGRRWGVGEPELSPSIAPQGGSQLLPLSFKAVPQPARPRFRCAQDLVWAHSAVFTFKRKRSKSHTGGAHTSENCQHGTWFLTLSAESVWLLSISKWRRKTKRGRKGAGEKKVREEKVSSRSVMTTVNVPSSFSE